MWFSAVANDFKLQGMYSPVAVPRTRDDPLFIFTSSLLHADILSTLLEMRDSMKIKRASRADEEEEEEEEDPEGGKGPAVAATAADSSALALVSIEPFDAG